MNLYNDISSYWWEIWLFSHPSQYLFRARCLDHHHHHHQTNNSYANNIIESLFELTPNNKIITFQVSRTRFTFNCHQFYMIYIHRKQYTKITLFCDFGIGVQKHITHILHSTSHIVFYDATHHTRVAYTPVPPPYNIIIFIYVIIIIKL